MVELSFDRKAVEITWDQSLVQGETVNIKTENADDVSGRADVKNDGRATLTYPNEFTGTTHVTVSGADGGLDEGDISV
jgi:hypothetical protein